jgi:hypothetical protein
VVVDEAALVAGRETRVGGVVEVRHDELLEDVLPEQKEDDQDLVRVNIAADGAIATCVPSPSGWTLGARRVLTTVIMSPE